jgi:hypothetical protein
MNWEQLIEPAGIAGGLMGGLRITAEILLLINKLIPGKFQKISIGLKFIAKVVAWAGVGKPKKLG